MRKTWPSPWLGISASRRINEEQFYVDCQYPKEGEKGEKKKTEKYEETQQCSFLLAVGLFLWIPQLYAHDKSIKQAPHNHFCQIHSSSQTPTRRNKERLQTKPSNEMINRNEKNIYIYLCIHEKLFEHHTLQHHPTRKPTWRKTRCMTPPFTQSTPHPNHMDHEKQRI